MIKDNNFGLDQIPHAISYHGKHQNKSQENRLITTLFCVIWYIFYIIEKANDLDGSPGKWKLMMALMILPSLCGNLHDFLWLAFHSSVHSHVLGMTSNGFSMKFFTVLWVKFLQCSRLHFLVGLTRPGNSGGSWEPRSK